MSSGTAGGPTAGGGHDGGDEPRDHDEELDSLLRSVLGDEPWRRAVDAVLTDLGRGRRRLEPPARPLTGPSVVPIGFRRRRLAFVTADGDATGLLELRRSFRSDDGALEVVVEQSAIGDVVVTLLAPPGRHTDPAALRRPPIVALEWLADGHHCQMVVPLGTRGARGSSARYGLGAVDEIVAAARLGDDSPDGTGGSGAVDQASVDAAFALQLHGDALAGWRELLAEGRCVPSVAAAVAARLGVRDEER